uniref:Uncharacterized protein n=1 Tax=Yersinia pestis Java 9 TaxID=880632 RepID=E8PS91_YERPE|nr:hypothetical protein YPJ_pJARS3539 [Yersinia pestis Java 9]
MLVKESLTPARALNTAPPELSARTFKSSFPTLRGLECSSIQS